MNFQKLFIKKALKYIPHHALLRFALKFRIAPLVNLLNRAAVRYIVKSSELKEYSKNEVDTYNNAVLNTLYWHGTGRFQHSRKGDKDVLVEVINTGGLVPADDVYGIFSGGKKMTTISLSGSRMIARSYADMHGLGYREQNRYGDALTWVSYYYGFFYARIYTVGYRSVKKYYKTWHSLTHDDNGHNTWGKKVNKNARDVWDVFGLGSDINGNYPVLFGIKKLGDMVELNKIFSDYEIRSSEEIGLEGMSHIEVPQAKIQEVRVLMKKNDIDIPVFSIELGEYLASKAEFSELLNT